jgi:drug/metabolite transporter (DMT)-like permease
MLALHYVIVQIVGAEGRLFGSAELVVGGYLSLATFSSALLLLWVRMIAIVPLLAWLSGLLYPPVWRDVKAFFVVYDRRLLMSLIGSGVFLLLSQTFLYIAINEIGPAVAATLAAIYPLATLPLTWMLFGDRPTRLKLVALVAIGLGTGMALFAAQTALSNEGIVAGVISSVTFALYLVAMLIINRRKLNPVPISLIQNSTMFVLSSLFLIGIGSRATPSNWLGLMVSGFVLGGLTIVSYFLNDVGSRLLGPARATLITASVPALTALLAFLVLPSPQNSLSFGQIFGILIVTAGSALLSLERIMNQVKAARQRRIEEYSNG